MAPTAHLPTTSPRYRGANSLVLCWDEDATQRLKEAGVTGERYCPLAVNQHQFHADATCDEARLLPVVLVGGPTSERTQILEAIADRGLSVYGYDGDAWRRSPKLRTCYCGQVLGRDRLRELYQRSVMSVNVTRPHGCVESEHEGVRSDGVRLSHADR